MSQYVAGLPKKRWNLCEKNGALDRNKISESEPSSSRKNVSGDVLQKA